MTIGTVVGETNGFAGSMQDQMTRPYNVFVNIASKKMSNTKRITYNETVDEELDPR
jgi:hypothetical protein